MVPSVGLLRTEAKPADPGGRVAPLCVPSVTALVALLAAAPCTQDFDQFEPALFLGAVRERLRREPAAPAEMRGGQTAAGGTTSSGAAGARREVHQLARMTIGDGAVDCADDDGGGFACLAAPEDWQGPGLLYQGPDAADVACPEGFSERVDVGGREPLDTPATLQPVRVRAPTVECETPAVTVYADGAWDGEHDAAGADGGLHQPRRRPSRPAATAPKRPAWIRRRALRRAARRRRRRRASVSRGSKAPPGRTPADVRPARPAPRRESTRRSSRASASGATGTGAARKGSASDTCSRARWSTTAAARDARATRAAALRGDADALRAEPLPGARRDRAVQRGSRRRSAPAVSVSLEVTGTGSCQPRGGDPTGEVEEGRGQDHRLLRPLNERSTALAARRRTTPRGRRALLPEDLDALEDDVLVGPIARGRHVGDAVDDVLPAHDLAEHRVTVVEVRRRPAR